MKKVVVLLICSILLFATCSCGGGAKQLPESFIEFEIEDYIALEDIENYYTYETKHSYDSASNLDTVDITITVQHDYADEIITGKCVYYYDKASDIWERARTTKWDEPKIEFIEKYLEKSYSGPFGALGSGGYEITIHDINLKNNTIDCSYFATTTVGWNTALTAEGKNVFQLKDGKSFIIPGDNGSFHVLLDEDIGIWIWSSD